MATKTTSSSNPILVETTRNYVVETVHRGVVCVVDKDGEVLYRAGNINQVVYPRSALKLVQVIPLIETGAADHYGFTDAELAVMCGSHNGEASHVEVVRSILSKAEIPEDLLQCGPHAPMLNEAALDLARSGETPSSIHNNCSGKHAGFLALAKFMKRSLDDYLSLEHPVQRLVRKAIRRLTGLKEDDMQWALDGCSAPNYTMSVYHLACMYNRLTLPEPDDLNFENAKKRVIQAISNEPYMVGGKERFCTEMMEVCAPRVVGKLGAEGIYCMAFPLEKAGAAIKIDDGSLGPQYNVAQKLILESRLFSREQMEPIFPYMSTAIKNCNQKLTGFRKAKKELFRGLTF